MRLLGNERRILGPIREGEGHQSSGSVYGQEPIWWLRSLLVYGSCSIEKFSKINHFDNSSGGGSALAELSPVFCGGPKDRDEAHGALV